MVTRTAFRNKVRSRVRVSRRAAHYSNNKGAIALSMVKKLNRQIEKKYSQLALSNTAITAGTSLQLLSVDQGIADTQRIGDKITLKSMKLRGILNCTTGNAGWVRVVIIRVTSPVVSTLGVPSTAIFETTSYTSQYLLDTNIKYTVVMDRTKWISDDSSHPPTQWLYNKSVACKDKVYDDDATQERGAYFMYFLHALSSPQLSFVATNRIKFTDL